MIPMLPPYVKEGGPAFPQTMPNDNGGTFQSYGMSMRDWFAGQALAGVCAQANEYSTLQEDAAFAYRMADAMLAEHAKWIKEQQSKPAAKPPKEASLGKNATETLRRYFAAGVYGSESYNMQRLLDELEAAGLTIAPIGAVEAP